MVFFLMKYLNFIKSFTQKSYRINSTMAGTINFEESNWHWLL
ncbi:hypothetical protein ADICYQ_4343 [Cyclobacterium qasimii M12-11B]|uniref:Uncharacterized protein n=1 Tax=Cyclobacterium qasimii M12-11B TaxID=641524 RepID=S7V9H2_9BACT|nr:hypothetical protein ADICYQ_4343 [Cyclobacterium qasimii M12-11B]